MSSERLARVLAPDYAAGVADLSLAEVRSRRHDAQEVELGLSYARRLVQGRLDIVHAEVEWRATGAGPRGAANTVEGLKDGRTLAGRDRPSDLGRLTVVKVPDDEDFLAEIDEAGCSSLAGLPELSDDEVGALAACLIDLERSMSARRHVLFERIDAFQAEIVRRYQSGAVTTDSLLA